MDLHQKIVRSVTGCEMKMAFSSPSTISRAQTLLFWQAVPLVDEKSYRFWSQNFSASFRHSQSLQGTSGEVLQVKHNFSGSWYPSTLCFWELHVDDQSTTFGKRRQCHGAAAHRTAWSIPGTEGFVSMDSSTTGWEVTGMCVTVGLLPLRDHWRLFHS